MILIKELEGLTRCPKDGGNENETCMKLPESRVKCRRNRKRRYSEDASSIHPCSSSRSNLYWPDNRGFQFRLKEKKKLKAARGTYLSTGLLRESAAMIIKVKRRFREGY